MKRIKQAVHVLLSILISTAVFGQVPVPVAPQQGPIMIIGATAHIGDGSVVQNSVIAFDGGKITIVADVSTDNTDRSGYSVIDATGKHVYPGFILPNSLVGIQEVSNIRQMNDNNEEGSINPNVRSIIAYNTDSEIPPTLRFNGILLAEPTPRGGVISGTSSVVELEGWNWQDAVHTMDVAMHLNWPSRMTRRFDFATFTVKTEENENYKSVVNSLEELFQDAISYGKLASKQANLKLKAMQGLFDGSSTLMLHCSGPKSIIDAVDFAKAQGVQRMAVITDDDAWYVRDYLKDNNIPVILTTILTTPPREDADYDLPFKLPYLLSEAGLMVSLSHTGMLGHARNLPFYAGTAAAYGMSKEDALKTITSNTAKILGIDDRVGTLTVGKDATMFICEGDALDMRTNNLSNAFIRGKDVTLNNKQQELFERFSRKYGHIE